MNLKELMGNIDKQNKEEIKKGNRINPMCFIINKKNELTLLSMMFENSSQKQMMKRVVKNFIINQSIKGYIMVFDCRMTIMDKKDKTKANVLDVVMTNLYTAKEKKVKMFCYKDKKILTTPKEIKDATSGFDNREGQDDWDLWGKPIEMNGKEVEEYNEFKKANPDLFRSVE